MAEAVLLAIFLIPSMLGLAEILHTIKSHILMPKSKEKKYLILYLENDFAEQQLRHTFEQYCWQGKKYAEGVISVSCGLETENFEKCRLFARENNIIFCSMDDLSVVLKNLQR